MTIWGINFWILYGIGWIVGILLLLWGWKIRKKASKYSFSMLPNMGMSFSFTPTLFIGLPAFLIYLSPSEKGIQHILWFFPMWYICLGISFLFLVLTEYLLRKKSEDQPDKASISLKELQKRQAEEVKKLITK